MKLFVLSAAVVSLVSQFALASPEAEGHAPVAMPKEFDTLKQLVGTWEGTTKMHGKEETTTVVYELTSGGTAISEKMGAGTPHEMITMYHKEGKSLAATHYCAMGNQPHMQLKSSAPNELSFEMTKPIGVSSMNEMHMHAVKLTLADNGDTLKQEWTSFMGGKKADTADFTFKRKK